MPLETTQRMFNTEMHGCGYAEMIFLSAVVRPLCIQTHTNIYIYFYTFLYLHAHTSSTTYLQDMCIRMLRTVRAKSLGICALSLRDGDVLKKPFPRDPHRVGALPLDSSLSPPPPLLNPPDHQFCMFASSATFGHRVIKGWGCKPYSINWTDAPLLIIISS